jgi:hypothetical protein
VELRAEFGTLYDDQRLADLYPPAGRPVEVAPWRLARVMVRPYREGRTAGQTAAAVRRGLDWPSALRLDWHDSGCAFTLRHDGRGRVRTHEAGQRVLASLPGRLQRAGGAAGAGHAPDGCAACSGGDSHAAPLGVWPGSEA